MPDRRSRGYSGSGRSPYALDREIDDLAVVLPASGTRHVVGLNSGGLIALWAASGLPGVDKVAVHEPAVFKSRASLPQREPSGAHRRS
ncbi:MAG: alpha/beta fold hydrolase [Kineosporiaceae bacterium]